MNHRLVTRWLTLHRPLSSRMASLPPLHCNGLEPYHCEPLFLTCSGSSLCSRGCQSYGPHRGGFCPPPPPLPSLLLPLQTPDPGSTWLASYTFVRLHRCTFMARVPAIPRPALMSALRSTLHHSSPDIRRESLEFNFKRFLGKIPYPSSSTITGFGETL
jgi:hypothetical protein